MPTGISMIWRTPLRLHSSISLALIRREALATSAKLGPTPPQNCCRPAPVPVNSTIGAAKPLLPCANRSATAREKG